MDTQIDLVDALSSAEDRSDIGDVRSSVDDFLGSEASVGVWNRGEVETQDEHNDHHAQFQARQSLPYSGVSIMFTSKLQIFDPVGGQRYQSNREDRLRKATSVPRRHHSLHLHPATSRAGRVPWSLATIFPRP